MESKERITRGQAREAYRTSRYPYDSIRRRDINTLWAICERHLMEYYLAGGLKAGQMCMKMARIRERDIAFKNDGHGLIHAALQVNGSYFKRREAITFSPCGVISFGSELDDTNVQPILAAFVEWCERGGNADD